ncbi:MAG: hypothetical protein JO197_01640 [Acidobacteria bacterium]|nr:hypothetical protein [Acidobacteriota bacterium]MBV9478865.1 hypothetical protein [Acidobacteriota bacterium]
MMLHRLVSLLALIPLTLLAQTNDTPFDAAARRAIAETVARTLETRYVLPEKGDALAKEVRAASARGDYDAAATPEALANSLNRLLASANDRHLAVHAAMPMRRDGVLVAEDLRRDNYGFRRVEHLDANIGYLDLGGFTPGDEAQRVAAGAMAFLANSDAIIVDLRRCPGGAADAVNFLASYFFGPEKRVLMNRYHRATNTSMESTTVDVPGKRLTDTPLYVLVGPHTASACESFSYTLQQWGRAKIVGERTAGAGYNNELVPLGHGLVFSVSAGTAIHPRSKRGWEAVGVQPDLPAPVDRALDFARAAILGVKPAAAEPVQPAAAVPPIRPGDYTGTYGNKEISIREGALYYQRIGGSGGTLHPLGNDRFDLGGEAVVTFFRDASGKVTRLRLEWPGHPVEEYDRAP